MSNSNGLREDMHKIHTEESRYGHLNPMQRKAVLTTEGPVLVLAGAGSGRQEY